jgi:hypothetical protein
MSKPVFKTNISKKTVYSRKSMGRSRNIMIQGFETAPPPMTAEGLKRPYGHRKEFDQEAEMLKSLNSLYHNHGIRISNFQDTKTKTNSTGIGTAEENERYNNVASSRTSKFKATGRIGGISPWQHLITPLQVDYQ